jgi:hypothetical protein
VAEAWLLLLLHLVLPGEEVEEVLLEVRVVETLPEEMSARVSFGNGGTKEVLLLPEGPTAGPLLEGLAASLLVFWLEASLWVTRGRSGYRSRRKGRKAPSGGRDGFLLLGECRLVAGRSEGDRIRAKRYPENRQLAVGWALVGLVLIFAAAA